MATSSLWFGDTDTSSTAGKKSLGLVVLIALACALGAVFLLVVAGILIERYRRKREGTPAPTTYLDKTSNMSRIPPEYLFGRLGERGPVDRPTIWARMTIPILRRFCPFWLISAEAFRGFLLTFHGTWLGKLFKKLRDWGANISILASNSRKEALFTTTFKADLGLMGASCP